MRVGTRVEDGVRLFDFALTSQISRQLTLMDDEIDSPLIYEWARLGYTKKHEGLDLYIDPIAVPLKADRQTGR